VNSPPFDLVLNKEMLPRTITRERWREIDHWRRSVRRKVAKIMDERIRVLSTHGSSLPPLVREQMIDEMVNPPIFAWPSS
jgi:hypothetical protein